MLLLERCVPGARLKCSLPEPEQDVTLARLMRRLWERQPQGGVSILVVLDDLRGRLVIDSLSHAWAGFQSLLSWMTSADVSSR